jgi:D-alanyl-D-alanine carboxypeptidase
MPLFREWGDMFYDYGAPPTASVLDENIVLLAVTPGKAPGQPATVKFNVSQDVDSVNAIHTHWL